MIANNMVVSFDYTLTDENDIELDSSQGRGPLKYLHGAGNIIPGLEKELAGKQTGHEFDVTVAAAEAYGEFNPEMIQTVPREAFQGVDTIEVGMTFHAQGPQGPVQVTVKEVEEESVIIDANHPLAGKDLTFKGKIVEVRAATEEEIAHGHVH